MSVSSTLRIDAKLDGVNWTNITSDVERPSVRHGHGIDGNDPLDVVAGSGELSFALRNDANGSRPVGYYSPGHANVRTGWDYGIQIRVVYNDGSDHTRWIGKVSEIDPDPNPKGSRVVRVVAYDYQHDLIDADARSIAPQAGQLESALITALLDSLPAAAQPPTRSLETGLDSVAFAFDRLGSGAKAASALSDVVRSAFGIYYTSGAGVGTYKTRQTRLSASSIATLTDTDISSFSGPTSRQGSFNVVRVTFHPKHTSSVTLWSYTGSTPQVVRAGETITVETPYRDPNQTNQPIGASAVTAPAAGTDYIAKEFSDGTGATLTGDLVLTGTVGYTTYTKWVIQNTGSTDAYLTTWQVRGTGIFDDGEQTVESRSTQNYGERVINLDLPYQDSRYISSGLAEIVRIQRENPTTIPREVTFIANRNSTLMTLAMTAEIGDIVTVSNAMTGVASATCAIQKIRYELLPATGSLTAVTLKVTFSLAPTSSLTTTPTAPTGLAVANGGDTALDLTWTCTDATAETEIYANGVLQTIVAPTTASYHLGGLTRATDYTITLRHIKYALIRSTATAGVVGRPVVAASGGTTFDSGGFRFHDFTSSGTFTITKDGRINWVIEGGGGGGGGGGDNAGGEIGGGGGGGGGYDYQTDNQEPIGSHAIVIGAGGAGGTTNGTDGLAGAPGTDSTYRTSVAQGRGGGYGGGVSGGNGANGGALAAGGGTAGGGGGGASGGAVRGVGGVGFHSTGGSGFPAGVGNSGGGGGGGGAAGNGTTPGGGTGGAGGSAVTLWVALGAGGRGGRVASPAAGAANTGNGGDGGDSVNNGKAGGSGWMRIWYPI